MNIPQIINRELFDRVSSEALVAPRRRKNFNFHVLLLRIRMVVKAMLLLLTFNRFLVKMSRQK
jgi:hypothetical protein